MDENGKEHCIFVEKSISVWIYYQIFHYNLCRLNQNAHIILSFLVCFICITKQNKTETTNYPLGNEWKNTKSQVK